MNDDNKKIDMALFFNELDAQLSRLRKETTCDRKIPILNRICEVLYEALKNQNTISCRGFLQNKGRINALERKCGNYKKAA